VFYKASKMGSHFDYEAGCFDTLRRMVDLNDGIAILPELATLDLTQRQLRPICYFISPKPMCEVSLVLDLYFVKQRLVEALKKEIMDTVPEKIRQNNSLNVVPMKNTAINIVRTKYWPCLTIFSFLKGQ
jgi:LysR family transcriptional regulator, hydrogen peroxide-inducible genes activator